jgi:large subunit ribosomal protein L35
MNNVKPGPLRFQGLGDLSGIVGTFIIHDHGDALWPELLGNAQKHGGERLFSAVGRNHDGFSHQAASIKPFFILWSKQTSGRSPSEIGFLLENFSLPDDVDSLAFVPFLMPKPIARSKTRKSVAKRFKVTSTGKVLRTRAGRRHLLQCKSAKRKRKLAKSVLVHDSDAAHIKSNLPFS